MNKFKIFDFNIHLPSIKISETSERINHELSVSTLDLINTYNNYKSYFIKYLDNLNIMIFNPDLIYSDVNLDKFINLLKNDFPDALLTVLMDFRNDNAFEIIDKSLEKGFKSIKFHSYIQKISESDHKSILKLSRYAADKKMFICIDCSFGTSKMYIYDNLKLAAFIADNIIDTPIILLHSGGARILEAMLLSQDKENIYLETSYSLPQYIDSSIETDLAYAYKKICHRKVLYASDFPYIKLEDSINITLEFLDKHKFSSSDIENIFYQNAYNLLNAY